MSPRKLLDFENADRTAAALRQVDLSTTVVDRLATRYSRLAETLTGLTGNPRPSACAHFVPGRIELFGKHTDYAGGRTVVAAAELGFCSLAVPRDDSVVRMLDVGRGQRTEFQLSAELEVVVGHWSNYPMTVARRVARNFGENLRGMDMAFVSDLPPAAGMSSSSAMIVMTFLALSELNSLPGRALFQRNIHSRAELAGYLGTIENGQSFGTLSGDQGVGTFGGSEDHTAILCSRPGCLVQFSYCPVRFERLIRLPDDYRFIIGVSGVVAEKTGAAMQQYNQASRRASVAAELWRQATGRDDPHLAAALASARGASQRMRQILTTSDHPEFAGQSLLDRVDQFTAENEEIIPQLPNRISEDELGAVGRLADRSQELGHKLLGNQVPQTVFLAHSAQRLGAAAASAFGAGFGGSVWALVPAMRAAEFTDRWRAEYGQEFPELASQAAFLVTSAGPSAISLSAPIPFDVPDDVVADTS